MNKWVKMPSSWLMDKNHLPLPNMKWRGDKKADQIAALMVYIILVQHANDEITQQKKEFGLCSLTYTELNDISGLSRAKISGGLKILISMGIISEIGAGRNNTYKIANYGSRGGWGKLPARGLYDRNHERIQAFHKFNLRSKTELNAMKMYLLIVALRNNATNYAHVGYIKIKEYTGISGNDIKSAISLLITLELIHVDTDDSELHPYSTSNMYRLRYLEPYKHRGTTAKELE